MSEAAPVLGPIGGPLVEHALAYATAGLEVFPVNPRDKTPLESQYHATVDADAIAAWWHQWPDALIGHRLPEGLVVTDIDPRHLGHTTWEALKGEIGTLPTTRVHASGRGDGGAHFWWQHPGGKLNVRGLNEWARQRRTGHGIEGSERWTAGIDLLHHSHRYTILPPSPHPDTGAPYQWVAGRGLQVAPAPMPALLVELLHEIERPTAPSLPLSPQADSIADWFSASTTWASLLEAHGWTRVAGDGEHDGSAWRHPQATSESSATIKHGCLFVYSPNTPFEPTESGDPHGYTPFAAYAVLEHQGDQRAAAKAARERHGGPLSGPIDVHAMVGQPAPLSTPAVVEEAEVTEQVAVGSSWLRTDLGSIVEGLVSGTLERPLPTLGCFAGTDGGLFYAGRVNGLYGEPGKGKTWIALAVVAEVLAGGGAVGWIDLEEPAPGIVGRLLDLGVEPGVIVERFAHFAPEETIRHAAALQAALDELEPALVVIDSCGEALAIEGAGPNNDDEVASWFRTWPRWLANRPGAPGVIVIDHVVKDEGTRGLWPGGSQRKKAAINGSAFMATPIKELGRGVEGRLKLVTSKDRNGHHRTGHKAAEFVLDSTGPAMAWRLERAEQLAEGEVFRPTVLMERVSRYLEEHSPEAANTNEVLKAVTGKHAGIRQALEVLAAEGHIESLASGQSHIHKLVRYFRELDEVVGQGEAEEA